MTSLRLIAATFVALPILWMDCPPSSDVPKASVGIAHSAQTDLQDDDDLDALVAWFYSSVSNTQIKPSDVFCGNCPKGGQNCSWAAPTGACTGARAGRIAREHVEVRGWVREIIVHKDGPRPGYNKACDVCGAYKDCEDEFLFYLDLDHDWTVVAFGVHPINSAHEVNAATTAHNVWGESYFTRNLGFGTPHLKVEINGWGRGRMCRTSGWGPWKRETDHPAPDDWKPVQGTAARWPFDPENPPSLLSGLLKVGDYVRMVGTLWEDGAHGFEECWGRGKTAGRGWVELHPVDFLARLDSPPRTETIEVIAIAPREDAFPVGCHKDAEITREIRPPDGSRPSATATIGFEEIPDEAFTSWETVETADRVTVLPYGIRVHVRVHSTVPGLGKFKALYRVFWRE